MFGEKLIQIAVMKQGRVTVRCQIPYANVESVIVAKEKSQKIVAIQLKNLNDSDTYNRDEEKRGFFSFHARHNRGLCHCAIFDCYQDTVQNICRRIEERIKAG